MSRSTASAGERRPPSTAAICLGNRQLDSEARTQGERRPGRYARPRQSCACAAGSRRGTATPELETDMTIAAEISSARQHQVAEAAQAGERFAPATFGVREPRDLDQPARDERGHRVVAKVQPFDDADAMAMMFLIAAPISTPTARRRSRTAGAPDREIDPARMTPQRRRPMPRRPPSAGPAHFRRKAGTGQHDDRMTGRRFIPHHQRHPLQRIGLEAFGRAHEHRVAGSDDATARATARNPCEGTATITFSRPQGGLRPRHRRHPIWQRAIRRYRGFARSATIAATRSGSRAHSRTSCPTRAR